MANFFQPSRPRDRENKGFVRSFGAAPTDHDDLLKTASRTAYAQRKAEEAMAEQQAEAQREQKNFEVERRAKREDRETITNPAGEKEFLYSDREHAAQQAAELAEEAEKTAFEKQQDARRLRFKQQGRAYDTTSEGEVVPVLNNRKWRKEQAEKKREEKLEKRRDRFRQDYETQRQVYEIEKNNRPVFNDTDRQDLEKNLSVEVEQAMYDAIDSESLNETEKQRIESVLEDSIAKGSGLTADNIPEDLAGRLAATDPERWGRIGQLRTTLQTDSENRDWRADTAKAVEIAELKAMNPKKWRELYGESTKSQGDQGTEGEALPPRILTEEDHRKAVESFNEKQKALTQRFEPINRKWQTLTAENAKLQETGAAAEDWEAVTMTDGTEAMFHKSLVGRLKNLSKLSQRADAAFEKEVAALDKDRAFLETEGARLRDEAAARQAEQREQWESRLDKMAANPLQAGFAADFREADADYAERLEMIENDFSLTPVERQQAVATLYGDRLRRFQETTNRLQALPEAMQEIAETVERQQERYQGGKELTQEARETLFQQDFAELDAIAEKYGLPAGQVAKEARDYQDRSRPWRSFEQTRTLSRGDLIVNPALAWDDEGFSEAIAAAEASPEAKAAATEERQELKKATATRILDGLRMAPGFARWEEKFLADKRGQVGAVETLDSYFEKRGGFRALSDNTALIVRQGVNDIAQQWFSLGGTINRNYGLTEGIREAGFAVLEDLSSGEDALTYESGAMGEALDADEVPQFVQDVGRAGVSMVPALAGGGVGAATRGLTSRLLVSGSSTLGTAGRLAMGNVTTRGIDKITPAMAKTMAKRAGLGGAGAGAFMQSFGAVYPEAIRQFEERGLSSDEAMDAAMMPALGSGLFTAAITMAFGKTGVEKLLAGRPLESATVSQLAKGLGTAARKKRLRKAFRSKAFHRLVDNALLSAGKDVGGEAVEEGLDELVSSLIGLGTYADDDRTIGQAVQEALYAGGIGAVLGGGAGAIKAGADLVSRRRSPSQLPERAVLSDAEIENFAPPENDDVMWYPEQVDRARNRARAMRKVAAGDAVNATDAELEAIGLERNDQGEIKQRVSRQSDFAEGEPVRIAVVEAGDVILTDPGLDWLQKYFPRTRETVGMGEAEARAMLREQREARENEAATNASEAGDGAGGEAGTRGEAAEETLEERAGTSYQGDGVAVSQREEQPGTANDDSVSSNQDRIDDLTAFAVDRGLDSENARQAAEAHVRARGVTDPDYMIQALRDFWPTVEQVIEAEGIPIQTTGNNEESLRPTGESEAEPEIQGQAREGVSSLPETDSEAGDTGGSASSKLGIPDSLTAQLEAREIYGTPKAAKKYLKESRPMAKAMLTLTEGAEVSPAALKELREESFADENGQPTQEGLDWLRQLYPDTEQAVRNYEARDTRPPTTETSPDPESKTPQAPASPAKPNIVPAKVAASRTVDEAIDNAFAALRKTFEVLGVDRIVETETGGTHAFLADFDRGEVQVDRVTAREWYGNRPNFAAEIYKVVEEEFWHLATAEAIREKTGGKAGLNETMSRVWTEFTEAHPELADSVSKAYGIDFTQNPTAGGWEVARMVMQYRHGGGITSESASGKRAAAAVDQAFAAYFEEKGFTITGALREVIEALIEFLGGKTDITRELRDLADMAYSIVQDGLPPSRAGPATESSPSPSPEPTSNPGYVPAAGDTVKNTLNGGEFEIMRIDGGNVIGRKAGTKTRGSRLGPVQYFGRIYEKVDGTKGQGTKAEAVEVDRPDTPVLNFLRENPVRAKNQFIAEFGRIAARKKAGRPLTERQGQVIADYDGQPKQGDVASKLRKYMKGVFAREGGQNPSTVAQMLADRGLIEDGTVSSLYAKIDEELAFLNKAVVSVPTNAPKEVKRRAEAQRIAYESGESVEQIDRLMQREDWEESTILRDQGLAWTKKKQNLLGMDLRPGETIIVDGTPVRVTGRSGDNIQLDGGQRFGIRTVAGDDEIWVTELRDARGEKREIPEMAYGARPEGYDADRHNDLEQKFADEKRILSQPEIEELEALRDAAGQGSLFGEETRSRESEARSAERRRLAIAAGQNRRLVGADIETQVDAFEEPAETSGQGLLFGGNPSENNESEVAPSPVLSYVSSDETRSEQTSSPTEVQSYLRRSENTDVEQRSYAAAESAFEVPPEIIRRRQLSRDQARIILWASETGRLLDPSGFPEAMLGLGEVATAMEHHVYHDESSARAVKVTRAEGFGVNNRLDGYLNNLSESNRFFLDDIRVEGVWIDDGAVHIVISQPWIAGSAATVPEIAAYFEQIGFKAAGNEAYYDTNRDILISDAHVNNVLRGQDGNIYPIDVHVRRVTSDYEQDMYTNRVRAMENGVYSANPNEQFFDFGTSGDLGDANQMGFDFSGDSDRKGGTALGSSGNVPADVDTDTPESDAPTTRTDLAGDSPRGAVETFGEQGDLFVPEPGGGTTGASGGSRGSSGGGAGGRGGRASGNGGESGAADVDRQGSGARRTATGDTGNSQPGGSRRSNQSRELTEAGADTSTDGIPPQRPATDNVAVDREKSLEERLAEQREAERIPADSIGDIENIRATLPVLLEKQQEDVVKAEKRLLLPDKDGNRHRGILFTNGTGTGKTFTGLGIAKRFQRRGKDRILIVVPTQKKVQDWVESAEFLQLRAKRLEGVSDAGPGVLVTTYANFHQNEAVAGQDFDLVMYDESHKIQQNGQGNQGATFDAHQIVTNHPLRIENKAARRVLGEFPQDPTDPTPEEERATKAAQERWTQARHDRKADIEREARRLESVDTKVVFLSATPFAYHRTLQYADGYLFETKVDRNATGYNVPQGFDRFLIENLGYQMKYNRPERPPAEVDVSYMERELNDRLSKEGALSGRAIDVPYDYSREFVIVDSTTAARLDEGFNILRGWSEDADERKRLNDAYPDLISGFNSYWNYNRTQQLLESAKVAAALDRIGEHLDRGRKVVLFHSFNNAQPVHPFRLNYLSPDPDSRSGRDFYEQVSEFQAEFPHLSRLDLGALFNPLDMITSEFGDQAVFFNGKVPNRQRSANVKDFNDDNGTARIIVTQMEAGKEGISLHDTTGKFQRVVMNVALPIRPTDAIQTEGRAYRVGLASNAINEYIVLHTGMERNAFGSKINERVSTAENLAMGSKARGLKDRFKQGYLDAHSERPSDKQGLGGKELDFQFEEVTPFTRAKSLYYARQKKTSGNKSAEGSDYFATPEPIGFKMVEWANLKAGESALEPSAGHGAIGRFFPDYTTNHFIEPSAQLSNELRIKIDSGSVHNEVFEDFNIVNKADAVVMNPPFGANGGKLAFEHVEKAARHLREGGRIVALVPSGPAADKRMDQFLYPPEIDGKPDKKAIGNSLHLRASFELPGVTFARAGTAVRTRILILDKVSDPEIAQTLTQRSPRDYSQITDINELFDRIEDVEVPDRPKVTEISESTVTSETATTTSTAGLDPESVTLEKFLESLDWSDTREIDTRRGPKTIRTTTPTEDVWEVWKAQKSEFPKLGYTLKRYGREWTLTDWKPNERGTTAGGANPNQMAFDFGVSGDLGDANQRGLDLSQSDVDKKADQAYIEAHEIPSEKQQAAKGDLDAIRNPRFAGRPLSERPGADRNEFERRRSSASRAYRGLTSADADAIREGFREGNTISSILTDFISREIPSFDIRGQKIISPEEFAQLNLAVRSPFMETVKVAVLDEDSTVLHSQILNVGALAESIVDMPGIVAAIDQARRQNPESTVSGFLIAHNHPSGDPTPSSADHSITKQLETLGDRIGVPMVDHIVTNGEMFYSFKGEYTESIPNGLGNLAEWETVRRDDRPRVSGPDDIDRILQAVETADPNHDHAVYFDTKMRIVAIERIPSTLSDTEKIARMQLGAGSQGARKVIYSTPPREGFPQELISKLRKASDNSIEFLDLVTFDANKNTQSARELGLMEEGGGYAAAANPNTDTAPLDAVTETLPAKPKALLDGLMSGLEVEDAADAAGYDRNQGGIIAKNIGKRVIGRLRREGNSVEKIREMVFEKSGISSHESGTVRRLPDNEKTYEKGSTQINLPSDATQAVFDFQKTIDPEDIYTEPNDYGLEEEPHVTVLYGLTGKVASDQIEVLKEIPMPVRFELGKLSLFENDKYDVLKIDVSGRQLHAANKKLRDSVDFENDYPDYKPHTTIAYLKPGTGKKYTFAASPFEGMKIEGGEIRLSMANGRRYGVSNGDQTNVAFSSNPVTPTAQQGAPAPTTTRQPGETLIDAALNRTRAAIEATPTVAALKKHLAEQYAKPLAKPLRKVVAFLVKEAAPLHRLPQEAQAMMNELRIKQVFGREKAMDVVRSLSGKAKFSDLSWPAQYANDLNVRKRLFLAMQGKTDMATLPPEIQDIGKKLRERLEQSAMEAVRQGRMNADTYLTMRDNYMPHYYYDHEVAKNTLGGMFRRLKLGLQDIMAQRTTMYRIEDMDVNDPNTGEPGALVTWDDAGRKVRFQSQQHRDAFYEDFIRQRTAETVQAHGKTKDFSDATKSQIDRLTPQSLNRPEKLTDELRGYAKRVEQQMRMRYQKGDPLTDEEQEKAGLIQDPIYAVSRHIAQMDHDNAIAEFFNEIAVKDEWIGGPNTEGYIELPNNPKLGKLSGLWIKEEIAREISELVEAPSTAAKLYDASLALWKTGKTVYNPGTHMRNMLGNVLFAQMAGINPMNPRNGKFFNRAWNVIRDGGPILEEMFENGVLGGDFLTSELQQEIQAVLPSLAVDDKADIWVKLGTTLDRAWHKSGGAKAKAKIEGAYRLEDELFKAAAYLKARAIAGGGADMDPQQAAAHVRKWFPYYDHIGQSASIKAARRTAMPFFSFQREAIRILAHAANERPFTLAASMALPAALTAMSAAALGLSYEEYKEVLQTAMRGKGRFFGRELPLFSILLPTRSKEGRLQQLDLTNVMPFASLLGRRLEMDNGMPAWQQWALELVAGSPLTGIPLETAVNKDTFSNRPIWEENMTTGEKAGEWGKYVWSQLAPPLVPGGTGANMLAQAGDRYSNKSLERRNVAQSYLRAVSGIDVRNASPNIYDLADNWRAEAGVDKPDHWSGSSTPESRARGRIFAELVQDEPNIDAIARDLAFLKEQGNPIETEQDIQRLLFYRNPIMVIKGEENQRRFRRSLTPEARRILSDAEREFSRVQRTSGPLLRRARAQAMRKRKELAAR